jgi:hypothetical protein
MLSMLVLLAAALALQPDHVMRDVEGWKVQVDRRLLEEPNRELGSRTLRLVADQLFQIKDRVSASKVAKLQAVTIWVDLNNQDLDRAQYHPSKEWLKEHGFDPVMEKGVHIPQAASFAKASFQFAQPFAILHEMAHAYHDRVLGFENPDVKAAWAKFAADPRHASVLRYSGRMEKHYGVTNQMEYFAEMTESYFGTNDFFPFVRAELQREESDSFQLMQRIWQD